MFYANRTWLLPLSRSDDLADEFAWHLCTPCRKATCRTQAELKTRIISTFHSWYRRAKPIQGHLLSYLHSAKSKLDKNVLRRLRSSTTIIRKALPAMVLNPSTVQQAIYDIDRLENEFISHLAEVFGGIFPLMIVFTRSINAQWRLPQPPQYPSFPDGACLCCGETENLSKHHVIPRAFLAHIHAPEVLAPLCVPCHTYYEQSAHGLKSFLLFGTMSDSLLHLGQMARRYVYEPLDDRARFNLQELLQVAIAKHYPELANEFIENDMLLRIIKQVEEHERQTCHLLSLGTDHELLCQAWLDHFSHHVMQRRAELLGAKILE